MGTGPNSEEYDEESELEGEDLFMARPMAPARLQRILGRKRGMD